MKCLNKCGDEAVAKRRCRTCYRYWLRHARRRDRDMVAIYERRNAQLAMAQEVRQLIWQAREGITVS